MQQSKRFLAFVIALTLLFPVLNFSSFADTQERYSVTLLKAGKVITGDATGNVNEDKPLKREELVAMLLQMSEPKLDGSFVLPSTPSFSDVPKTHWAYEIVEKGKYYGLTSGIGKGLFGIGQQVTYQQALSFVTKMVGLELPWGTILTEAPQYGFVSVEPSNGGKFLRGHMFDLTVKALMHYDYATDDNWGKHIISKMGDTHKQNIEQYKLGAPYINDAKYAATAWGPSVHASQQQLAGRFDASKLTWSNAKIADLSAVKFNLELPDEEFGNVIWSIAYNDQSNTLSGEFHGAGYGGFMDLNIESVYSNTTLKVNDKAVTTYLIKGFGHFGSGLEPYRMIIQMDGNGFVKGWMDGYSLTRDMTK